ncbi:MAG: flavodoxin-dependent (E)-4-hydroxy-3-methylbut-2-enyl-diphosphate synthase [Armatimonadetes bacterium]|nr:flavodoxin-dependent (E)-4-hydroxy-3-methylbut-2-enyl-diphosphate synthase [Armatimonadota bacterium]
MSGKRPAPIPTDSPLPAVPWPRRPTRRVQVGCLTIGGGAPITVQTMAKTDPLDVPGTVAQIRSVTAAGADIVRLAVPNRRGAAAFAEIRQQVGVPLVADIHFDYRLAIAALKAGADKIRINPGNIGGDDRLGAVVEAAAERGVPIRVGVNAGSLEGTLLDKYGGPTAEAAAVSALHSVARMERLGFSNIVVSIKASDIRRTVLANRLFARETDYPLHIGVTEAGVGEAAIASSSAAAGILLAEGLGDTLRVSITGDPVGEVRVGRSLLVAMGLLAGPRLVSCPTCGRCQADVRSLAEAVQRELLAVDAPIVVAVMGCEVNGPGEAREADVGLAAGRGQATLFRRGERLRTIPIDEALSALMDEVRSVSEER